MSPKLMVQLQLHQISMCFEQGEQAMVQQWQKAGACREVHPQQAALL